MATTLRCSHSYSAHNLHTLSGGMLLNELDRSSYTLNGGFGSKVYGFTSAMVSGNELSLFDNKKTTMQDLNNRLASYLEKVKRLETANKKIEQQIKEFYESKSPMQQKDLTQYYSTIQDLHQKISKRTKENGEFCLLLDNSKMAADDFKLKLEMEMTLRLTVEADIHHLKNVIKELQIAKKDLEFEITSLKEELVFLKKSHSEDMLNMKKGGSVKVEVDCAPATDLEKGMQEMREQYEAVIQKNQRQIEVWFQSKAEVLKSEINTSHTEIKSSKSVLKDVQIKQKTLEIELNGILMQKNVLENNLAEMRVRNSDLLKKLQLDIDRLQEELQQINISIEQQATEYQLLLNIKMRLEQEIAEYRRLLDGEGGGTSFSALTTSSTSNITVITETVTETETINEEKEDEYHLHQKRVKVIVEELVDGVVVSTSVEEQIHDVNK